MKCNSERCEEHVTVSIARETTAGKTGKRKFSKKLRKASCITSSHIAQQRIARARSCISQRSGGPTRDDDAPAEESFAYFADFPALPSLHVACSVSCFILPSAHRILCSSCPLLFIPLLSMSFMSSAPSVL